MKTTNTNKRQTPTATSPVATNATPPVIVLSLFHSGLGIVRSLSRTGVRVIGLSAHPTIYGAFTRLCEVRNAPDSQEQSEKLAHLLQRTATDLKGAIIFPTRDADLWFLDRFRSVLEPLYRLAVPPRQTLQHIMNKDSLMEIARNAGIATPLTLLVDRRSALNLAADKIGFPCILKPVSAI